MFLRIGSPQSGYGRHGQQWGKGWFLIAFSREREIRVVVKKAHLKQCGHFMMGDVELGDHVIVLSGPLGHDGLPCDAPDDLWPRLHPIPPDVAEPYWKGTGDYDILGTWAETNFKKVKRLLPDPAPQPPSNYVLPYVAIKGPIRVPYVDDGVQRPSYVSRGDRVRYKNLSGHEAFARVVCKAQRDGEEWVVVLELSENTHYAFERWCKPEDFVAKLPRENSLRDWFFTAERLGSNVLGADRYGALTGDSIVNHLDTYGELVFPEAEWREISPGEFTCRREGCTLRVFRDAGIAQVFNTDGEKGLGKLPEEQEPGAFYMEKIVPVSQVPLQWDKESVAKFTKELQDWCVQRLGVHREAENKRLATLREMRKKDKEHGTEV